MAYDERLAQHIREQLAGVNNVEEKKMFRGITFMVEGKMCICVSGDELMCRIDPAIQEELVQKKGCRRMQMRGSEMKGYVLVSSEVLKTKEDFEYWTGLCLAFNIQAKASRKRKK